MTSKGNSYGISQPPHIFFSQLKLAKGTKKNNVDIEPVADLEDQMLLGSTQMGEAQCPSPYRRPEWLRAPPSSACPLCVSVELLMLSARST